MYPLLLAIVISIGMFHGLTRAEEPLLKELGTLNASAPGAKTSYNAEIRSLAFSPDGKTLATGAGAITGGTTRLGVIRLWDLANQKQIALHSAQTGSVWSLAYLAEGQHLVAGCFDGTVNVWDLTTGKVTLSIKAHRGEVTSVAVAPDGKTVASGSYDQTVKTWDLASGKLLHTFGDRHDKVTSVCFSPDGELLASGSWDETVKLWDPATGKLLATLQGHDYWVTSVAFSPNGKLLASGSWDNTIKIWDVAAAKEVRSLPTEMHQGPLVAFTADGTQLVGAGPRLGFSGLVQQWDTATWTTQAKFEWRSGGLLRAVAVHRQGKVVAVNREDATKLLQLVVPKRVGPRE